jgi:TRAP-type C4-dicarboxylate transport system permease small subunit
MSASTANGKRLTAANHFSERLAKILSFLGMIPILAMALHISLDVVFRAVFNSSIPATEEIVTQYYMVGLALLPLAWVEQTNNMISVEAFESLYRGVFEVVFKLSALAIGIFIYATFSYATLVKAIDRFEVGAYVMSLNFPMPIWPTYFVPPIAFACAALVLIIKLVSALGPSDLINE